MAKIDSYELYGIYMLIIPAVEELLCDLGGALLYEQPEIPARAIQVLSPGEPDTFWKGRGFTSEISAENWLATREHHRPHLLYYPTRQFIGENYRQFFNGSGRKKLMGAVFDAVVDHLNYLRSGRGFSLFVKDDIKNGDLIERIRARMAQALYQ